MRLPRVSAPVHGIDFSQMPPQCPSSAHLNSANRVDVSCDLNQIKKERKSHLHASKYAFFYLHSGFKLGGIVRWYLYLLNNYRYD